MKGIACGIALTLLLLITACATSQEQTKLTALYAEFDQHCREHARDMTAEVDEQERYEECMMTAEVDEQERYEECMAYFINTDADSPLAETDPHLSKAQ